VLAGRSASVAASAKVKVLFSLMVLVAIAGRTGASFTSFTVTVNVLASLICLLLTASGLLSVTRTVMG